MENKTIELLPYKTLHISNPKLIDDMKAQSDWFKYSPQEVYDNSPSLSSIPKSYIENYLKLNDLTPQTKLKITYQAFTDKDSLNLSPNLLIQGIMNVASTPTSISFSSKNKNLLLKQGTSQNQSILALYGDVLIFDANLDFEINEGFMGVYIEITSKPTI